MTVNPKAVKVKADDKEKTYGEDDPELTAKVEGKLDDGSRVNYTLTRADSENNNVGEYEITATGDEIQGNYKVSYEGGTFTIKGKPVTVTADGKRKVYGDPDPEFTASVEGVPGDDSVNYTLSRKAGENAGEHEITPSGEKIQGNYEVTFVPGTLVIERKKATLKAEDKSKTYGEPDPEFTAKAEGVLEGDTLNYDGYREEGEDVKTYAITIVPRDNPNYDVQAFGGTFTINRKHASGTAGSAARTFFLETEQPENGEITVSTGYASKGETIIVTVIPAEGCKAKDVIVTDENGNPVETTPGEDGKYSFVMPSSKVKIKAEFEKTEEGAKERPSAKFKDVVKDEWYCEYIDYVVENGIMNGTSEDTFEPEEAISRAMFVTVLYRMEGEPEIKTKSGFKDVDDDNEECWYAKAVAWAREKGVVVGYENNFFGPDDPLTREQFATILYRYAKIKGYNVDKTKDISSYDDYKFISPWALAALRWANAEELITGRTEKTLVPDGECTRAETAAVITRFCEKIKK